jgi:hypothetical protein
MIKKFSFVYTSILICILLPFLCTGCHDQYRYFCQDPDNFKSERCQKPICEFNQDCPEYLVAPILEKKIEGTPAPVAQQPQGTPVCR